MPAATGTDPRRALPSVDLALRWPEVLSLVAAHGRPAVVAAVRETLEERRRAGGDVGPDDLAAAVARRLARAERPSLVRVINATGVVVHTNLGRAPLSPEAAARVAEVARSYSNLEYDLERGSRGNREAHAEARLRALLGAESTVVVNNCAAAVLLAVNTLAEGREVIVSRGELVEIGGSFRIPEVLRKGGARLREVGTTNRTRLADYRDALSPETGMILKVHPSNFRVVGFAEETTLAELAALAREASVPLVEDQGSGLLGRLPGPLGAEPTALDALAQGADVVAWSGDKLLGGPQAGILAGGRAFVEPMRRNPLYRALRVDKMTLAALDATLVEHAAGRAAERVPVLRMILASREELGRRAAAFAAALAGQAPGLEPRVVETASAVGGGAAPTVELPTVAVAIRPGSGGADGCAARLREGEPPVVARVMEDRVIVDLRTVDPEDEAALVAALVRAAR